MDSEFLAEYVHGRHTIDDYFERFVHGGCFDTALAECATNVRDRYRAALRSAFARLDTVPRTDPLWARSNNRVTFTKLYERLELPRIDDDDLESCWMAFVIALCMGDVERFERASGVLLRASQLQVSEFLRIALNLSYVSGWETEDVTARIVVGLGVGEAARRALEDITKQAPLDGSLWGEDVVRLWAENVVRRLDGAGQQAVAADGASPRR